MTSQQKKQPYVAPFSHRLLAGGIAGKSLTIQIKFIFFYNQFKYCNLSNLGICEILVMYPTDVVKTRAQLSVGKQQQNMFTIMYSIYKQEG